MQSPFIKSAAEDAIANLQRRHDKPLMGGKTTEIIKDTRDYRNANGYTEYVQLNGNQEFVGLDNSDDQWLELNFILTPNAANTTAMNVFFYGFNIVNFDETAYTVTLTGGGNVLVTEIASTQTVTISCNQTACFALFQNIVANPIYVKYFRINGASALQAQQGLTYKRHDNSGKRISDNFTPTITPNQFQSGVIDVKISQIFDGVTYLAYPVLPSVTATMVSMFYNKSGNVRNDLKAA